MKKALRLALGGALVAIVAGCGIGRISLEPPTPGSRGTLCRVNSDCLSNKCALTTNSDPPTGTCT